MWFELVICVLTSTANARHLAGKQENSTLSLYDFFSSGFVETSNSNETDWLNKTFHTDDDSQESDYNNERQHLPTEQKTHRNEATPIHGHVFERVDSKQGFQSKGVLTSKTINDTVKRTDFKSTQIGGTNTNIGTVKQNGQVLPVDEDRWIWDDGTTTTTLKPEEANRNTSVVSDLDDRTAFEGAQCPKGQIKIKGTNTCIDTD
ncbi:uncharacterized protein LOC131849832 [Achroia grisella]|uniref:uncharacterized protein LOC131849832 n=1 Tax=Achroia grisella TaxID=688607 RepID=UPI0027D2EA50|nr:uncharacterized protein LOC131849832 [Achroia grisella]